MNQYKTMTDEYLRKTYVPDVYQNSIFNIDYKQLQNAGIKLISFDIDDTIVPIARQKPTKAAITLIEQLKLMGFAIYLVSNANDDRVKLFSDVLNVSGVSRASKPHIDAFEQIRQMYIEANNADLSPAEMAHVGNSMIKDAATGNTYGVTTCLVRDVGILPKTGRTLNPFKTEGEKLRKVLLKRGIWRKHHLKAKNDQYYQLDDTPSKQFR